MSNGAEDATRGTELKVKSTAAQEGDIETQLNLLESAIARQDRGIIFAPVETLASRSAVLMATRKHIPVAVIDDDLGPPAGPFLSYVTSDETVGVRLAVERLAKRLGGQGSIVILGINPRLEGSITREELLEHALSEVAPRIKIVLRQFGDASITHQQQICAEILNSEKPPDAIVALSTAATRGAVYAKIARNPQMATIIIGFDQDLTLPLRNGVVDAVVVQNTRVIGRTAMRNIIAQLKGESVSPHTLVLPILVTQENLNSPPVASLLTRAQTAFAGDKTDKATGIAAETNTDVLIQEARQHALQPGVQEIGSFIRLPGSHPNVTVQGTVFLLSPMLGVQDATASIFVYNYPANHHLKLGDIVIVHGDLVSQRFRTRMENASVRRLWTEDPRAPHAVTASQLTAGYRGETIEVEGTVVSENENNGRLNLILRDGGQVFRSVFYDPPKGRAMRFDPGSRIRLRGTATSLPELTDGIYPYSVVATSAELVSKPPWWSTKHITILGIAFVFVLLAVQGTLQAMQRWHLRSVLKEREQLAFEIHDTLAQSFTGIAYQLQAAREEKNGNAAVQQHIEHALEMVAMSHREASRTIAALRPQERDASGVLAALKQLAERLSSGGGLTVHTTLSGRSSELRLEMADAFFRIGQEAISNAIQHGHCRTLSVELQFERRKATLKICDDGRGFSPSLESTGLGIVAMKWRSERIRGTFSLTSTEGHGTTVMVSCPFHFANGVVQRLRIKFRTNRLSRFTV